MTLENEPTESMNDDAATPGEASNEVSTALASAPAGEPTSEPPTKPSIEPAIDAAPEPVAEAPAARPRSRRGRASAPAVGESAPEAAEAVDGGQPDAAQRPVRRATRKRSAPRPAPRTEDPRDVAAAEAVEGSAAAEPEAAVAEQPTPQATRGRRRRARSADVTAADVPPATAEPDAVQPDQVEEEVEDAAAQVAVAAAQQAVQAAGAAAAAAGEAEATAEEAADAQEAAEDVDEAVAVPFSDGGIMPLFQAPEPQPRRSRRAASRPAGPPRPTGPTREAADTDEEDLEDGVEPLDDVAEDAADVEDEDVTGEAAEGETRRRRRRRGGRGRRGRGRAEEETDEGGEEAEADAEDDEDEAGEDQPEDAEEGDEAAAEAAAGTRRRRRRRRRGTSAADTEPAPDDPPNTVVKIRDGRRGEDVSGVRGSTRLEAKKQRRREGREAGRRRTIVTEAEFLARRESVERVMVVRERDGRTQIGVLEDGVLVEHYVARKTQTSMVGNVYLGKVQNVLPSMEAAFVDIGKGRNAVLYAGEVNWDAAGLEGQPRRIEHALKAGESVLVQVTKDPIGHKGARLTSQISLPGRYLVFVPDGSMTGISRKLPDTERNRLKKILREIVPDDAGVIVRTAAEGASEEELERDVSRLRAQWQDIAGKVDAVNAPALLYGEPDLAIRVVRDVFNEDFTKLIVSGDDAWDTLEAYLGHVAPDLAPRLEQWSGEDDVFAAHRIDEQLAKGLDRKVWLPSGGSLVIDRTEAMTVIDVNTGKFTGAGGNLEETVTKNNMEAAEEVVRQLRLRDIGGIIVIDFIDMVLESNRDLVLRRLLECLGRDRTRHQVAEVTSLGLVQMTRKRVGQGLLEVFSETCETCGGRGVIVHDEPVERKPQEGGRNGGRSRAGRGAASAQGSS